MTCVGGVGRGGWEREGNGTIIGGEGATVFLSHKQK